MIGKKYQTTDGGKPGEMWAMVETESEAMAARRWYWSRGFVRVWSEHPKGRAWRWMKARREDLEMYERTRQMNDLSDGEYFGA